MNDLFSRLPSLSISLTQRIMNSEEAFEGVGNNKRRPADKGSCYVWQGL